MAVCLGNSLFRLDDVPVGLVEPLYFLLSVHLNLATQALFNARLFPTFLTAFFTAAAERPVFLFISHFIFLPHGYSGPVLLSSASRFLLRCSHLLLL